MRLHPLLQPFKDRAKEGVEKLKGRFVISGKPVLIGQKLGIQEQAGNKYINEKCEQGKEQAHTLNH